MNLLTFVSRRVAPVARPACAMSGKPVAPCVALPTGQRSGRAVNPSRQPWRSPGAGAARTYAQLPAGHTGAVSLPRERYFFYDHHFSPEQIQLVRLTSKDLHFRVLPLASCSPDNVETTRKFIALFFKEPVENYLDRGSDCDIHVLDFDARSIIDKDNGSALMYIGSRSAPAYHAAATEMNLWSPTPWRFTFATRDPGHPQASRPAVEIAFPAGYTRLRTPAECYLGLAGEDLSGTVTRWCEGLSVDAHRPPALQVIGGIAIPYSVVRPLHW